jgi:hypothetical protein
MGMTFDEVLSRAEDLAGELIDEATETRAEVFGLDPRAAYQLWLGSEHDCIIVPKDQDRTLQYYGGFEYVMAECRTELGGYVVYSAEDERVQGHIDRALDREEEEPPLSKEDIAAVKADLRNDAAKCDE